MRQRGMSGAGALTVIDSQIRGLEVGRGMAAVELRSARAAVDGLAQAIRPHVAMTLGEARSADARGERPIFCEVDVLNPCWAPGMPITVPLRHWGQAPDTQGGGLACPSCCLRAALAFFDGES